MYIDKLDNIFDKYNNNYHGAIKMNPMDVKTSTLIDFDVENNDKDPKCNVCDHVRITKYKNIFAKVSTSNGSEDVLVITISITATKI